MLLEELVFPVNINIEIRVQLIEVMYRDKGQVLDCCE
jgi:hypothetical protein